ncbi:AzlD domain-containing protein [Helicobacter sp. 12S02634-8]|uniref:branched-chain amino acid transporter permease n=1 Tax=Helicobacter sp. 12S02634-8 TaxID=1476199 RepID=UPI000BA5EF41|nr:AzlD domain-containing protein [Helicobacter sp. 12S02634-8]
MLDAVMILVVVMGVTIFARALPFMIFNSKHKAPDFLLYLGKVLPTAIVGMLIVYCFKNTDLTSTPYGLNELLGLICVVGMQCVFKISILSILSGTILYMYLLQSAVLEKIF